MIPTIIVVAVVGMALGYFFAERQRILRAIKKVPVTAVRDVKEGDARVTGKLGFVREPLVAPLSGRKCAYYEVRVERMRSKGGWHTIVHETSGQDFCLRDDTGKAFVTLDSTLVAVVLDVHMHSGFGDDASPTLEAFLARHGTSATGLVFNKTLRYREGVLEEGEDVSVLGSASWEVDPDPDAESLTGGYRDAPMRLVICSSEKTKLRVSDDPAVLRWTL